MDDTSQFLAHQNGLSQVFLAHHLFLAHQVFLAHFGTSKWLKPSVYLRPL